MGRGEGVLNKPDPGDGKRGVPEQAGVQRPHEPLLSGRRPLDAAEF